MGMGMGYGVTWKYYNISYSLWDCVSYDDCDGCYYLCARVMHERKLSLH